MRKPPKPSKANRNQHQRDQPPQLTPEQIKMFAALKSRRDRSQLLHQLMAQPPQPQPAQVA